MSNRTSHPDTPDPGPGGPGDRLPERLTRAQAIRAAADGEAPMEAVAPEDAPRVDFERALRRVVDDTAPRAGAPADLRAKVQQIFREHDTPTGVVTPASGADTREPSFWRRSSRWLATAAVLALCAAAVFMSLRNGSNGPFGGHQAAVQAASFVERENDACAVISERFERKFQARTPEQARELAQEMFEKTPGALLKTDDALAAVGYRFAGFGRCAVPGPGRSAHLVYHHTQSGPAEALSLFIQEAPTPCKLDTACCYVLPASEAGDDRVFAWRDGDFIYYLFSHDQRAVEAARDMLEAPKRQVAIR